MATKFGSNLLPPKFGVGLPVTSWKCVCDAANERWRIQCKDCGVKREYSEART